MTAAQENFPSHQAGPSSSAFYFMEMIIMNLNKLQAAYRRASQLAADPDVEPYQRDCYRQIAQDIWEGAGLSPASAEWQEVINYVTAERLVVANDRTTLQCFDFYIDRWEPKESDELPIEPDRLRRWLQAGSERAVAESRLLQVQPFKNWVNCQPGHSLPQKVNELLPGM